MRMACHSAAAQASHQSHPRGINHIHAVDAGISTSYSLSTSATTFCAAAMNFSTTAFAVSSAAERPSMSYALSSSCFMEGHYQHGTHEVLLVVLSDAISYRQVFN